MNHKWKTASLESLIQYNKWLLCSLVILSSLCLILGFAVLNKEEKWVLIPCNDIDNKMDITRNQLSPSYLRNWAIYVAKEVFTTSPIEVENQLAGIRRISSDTKELSKFFYQQLEFIKGSNATSVFFVKKVVSIDKGVRVTGTLSYWFGESEKKIALEKSYIISYQNAAKGLILLSNIEDDKEFFNK